MLKATPGNATLRYSLAGLFIAAMVVVLAVLVPAIGASVPRDLTPPVADVATPEIRYFGRIGLGLQHLTGSGPSSTTGIAPLGQLESQLDAAAADPISQIRAAPVMFELSGWLAARDMLDRADASLALYEAALDHDFGDSVWPPPPTADAEPSFVPPPTLLTSDDARALAADPVGTRAWIGRLRDDLDAFRSLLDSDGLGPDDLADDAKQRLLDRHDWYARLALTANESAQSPERLALQRDAAARLIVLGVMIAVAALVVLAGFALFIYATVLLATRRLRVRANWQPELHPAHRATLLEAAALFLVAFVVLSFVAQAFAALLNVDPGRTTMLAVWLLALVPLWPLLRGMSVPQLRIALGWHANGRGFHLPLKEAGLGLLGYMAGLPIVIVAVVFSLALVGLTGVEPQHPSVNQAIGGSTLDLVLLYLLATVWAPVVEETIFRGAMHASLRPAVPAVLAGVINASVFAVIHPQGWALAPALASLGFVFSLIREWRGSLIAPIVAHAAHNAFVITLAITILT